MMSILVRCDGSRNCGFVVPVGHLGPIMRTEGSGTLLLWQRRARPLGLFPGWVARRRRSRKDRMTLHDAVALSVLPGISRTRAAAVFKELREHSALEAVALTDVIAACGPDLAVESIAAAARSDAA